MNSTVFDLNNEKQFFLFIMIISFEIIKEYISPLMQA